MKGGRGGTWHAAGVVVANSGASGYQGRTPARHGLARDAERSGGRRGGAQRARAKNAPLSVLDRTADAQPRAARAEREPPPLRAAAGTAGTGPAWDDVDDPTTRTRRTRAAARRGARRAARAVNPPSSRTGFGSPFGFYTTLNVFGIYLFKARSELGRSRGRTVGG